MKACYPVTIFMARYGGTYEGGEWVAANAHADSVILDGAEADDVTCAAWFASPPVDIGVGHTPNEALDNLMKVKWGKD